VRGVLDAIGGRYKGGPIGDGRYSDVTVFSFHPVKIITTGEGGVAVANDPAIARTMALLNSHGITREASELTRETDGPWYYEQLRLGFNYRMTDSQAALGLSQLDRLDDYVARRHAIAARYDELLADMPVATPWRDPESYSGFHLYVVRLKANGASATHRQVFERMRSAGVLVNLHYIPVYRQPDFARFGYDPADFPQAEAYYREAISLPLFPTMTEAQQDEVVETLAAALRP
jgi:dTDP-4-amino-4,6-dideoxygalactose transaminase